MKWGIGCVGFLFLVVFAAGFGVWRMAQKYGISDDRAVVLERTATILPIEFPEPLQPGWTMYTANDQQDPLVLYGVQDRQSKLVVTLVSFDEPDVPAREFSNRMHNIRRDLTPWREVLDEGQPVMLTARGQQLEGISGDYVGEDGVARTAVLVVIPYEGRSVLLAVDGKTSEADAAYAQSLLDRL